MDEQTRKNLRGEAKVIGVVFGGLFLWLAANALPWGRQALWYAFVVIISVWGGKYVGMFLRAVLDDLLHNVIGLPRPQTSHQKEPEPRSSLPNQIR